MKLEDKVAIITSGGSAIAITAAVREEAAVHGQAALFLAPDDSGYVSGLTLPATDGGTLSRVAITFEEDAPSRPTFLPAQ
jgi:NAD(P)-dependent dehydrogenase (short-subunit alcohol dehydrogenase family)